MSLDKNMLDELYNEQKLSMAEMAARLGCSPNKVAYWMVKHAIQRRNISEAIYQWRNPGDDPFEIHLPETETDRELFFSQLVYISVKERSGPHEKFLCRTPIQKSFGYF